MATLTLAETAAKIGVTKKCIRYHLGRGALLGQKDATGEWQIFESSVDEFLEKRNRPGELGNDSKNPTAKKCEPKQKRKQLIEVIEQYKDEFAENKEEIKALYSRIEQLENRLKMLVEPGEVFPGEKREEPKKAFADKQIDGAIAGNDSSLQRLEKRVEDLSEENRQFQKESKMRHRWGIFYPVAEVLGFQE